MDFYPLLLVAVVILLIIFLVWFLAYTFIWLNPNPKDDGEKKSLERSTVTCRNLGKRGDMGNQLFQIAAVVAAAERSDAKWRIPSSYKTLPVSQLFSIPENKIFDGKHQAVYREYDNYENITVPKDGRIYSIEGYRQSYLYFNDYNWKIKELFKVNPELNAKVKAVLPDKYICIHIRMGDYIRWIHKIPFMEEFKRCTVDYYKNSLKFIKTVLGETADDYAVIICTDSPKKVREFMKDIDPNAQLSQNIEGVSGKFVDFLYIYNAHHIVMSNSTYSWWATYLNENRNKLVIAPDPWWDPNGYMGRAVRLDSHHLHYPCWILADPTTGEIVKQARGFEREGICYEDTEEKKTDAETLTVVRFFRGLFV